MKKKETMNALTIKPSDPDYLAFRSAYSAEKHIRSSKSVGIRLNDRRMKIDDGEKFYLPFEKVQKYFNFRPQELTAWSGETKSMKSMLSSYCLLSLAYQGQISSIASFEMPVETTYERMCSAYWGTQDFTSVQNANFSESIFKKIWFFDHLSTATLDEVETFIRYSAEILSVDHVMIDSLMMCTMPSARDSRLMDKSTKDFIVLLKEMAMQYSIHVHLVCHHKKPDGTRGNRYSIFGSSAIPNIADNVFIIERERNTDFAKEDLNFIIDSQRNGKDGFEIKLWLDDSFQFLEDFTNPCLKPEEFISGKFF